MTDFLDEKRREITDRLKELKPLVDEYHRLEAAASALAGVGGSAVRAAAARATGNAGRRTPPRLATRHHRGQSPPAKRPSRRQTARRPAQRQRHPRRRGAVLRPGPARDHDPRAGGQDGHQAELPLPRPARASSRKRRWKSRAAAGTRRASARRTARPARSRPAVSQTVATGRECAPAARVSVARGVCQRSRSAPGRRPCRARRRSSGNGGVDPARVRTRRSPGPRRSSTRRPRRCRGSR